MGSFHFLHAKRMSLPYQTEENHSPIRAFANQVFTLGSMIMTGSRKRGVDEETGQVSMATVLYRYNVLRCVCQIPSQADSTSSKVRLVEQSTWQTRAVLDAQEKQIARNHQQAEQREFQLEQAVKRITELEDLVKNGKHLLGEVKHNANNTKAELQRRLMELENLAKNDRALLVEAREHMAKADEVAWQRVAELEESLKNKGTLLEEATKYAEKEKQDAQRRVAELEEYVENTTQDAHRRIAELEASAVRGRSSLQMPGGLPTLADTMEIDVGGGPTGCKFQSFNDIYCLNIYCAVINNTLPAEHRDSVISEEGSPELVDNTAHIEPITGLEDDCSMVTIESDESDSDLVNFHPS